MESLNDAQSSFPQIGWISPLLFHVRLLDEECVALWILDCVLFRIPMCIVSFCGCVCVPLSLRALECGCGRCGACCRGRSKRQITPDKNRIKLPTEGTYQIRHSSLVHSIYAQSSAFCPQYLLLIESERSFPFKCARCSITRLRSQQGNTTFTEIEEENAVPIVRERYGMVVIGCDLARYALRGPCFQVCSKKRNGSVLAWE
jgi:hypothetical protein